MSDPLATALFELRSVFHVHSPYSHDACDGQGLTDGVPNAACREDLRRAICDDGLDFVGLTDHPDYMRFYPMQDELLIDSARGDQPIVNAGVIAGNRLKCEDGRTVIITQGYESKHTLPIGFSQQPSSLSAYHNLLDERPIADMQSLVAELKANGAVVGVAHSEWGDLSAQTLLAAGVDAMEWYNPHGNFTAVLGGESGTDVLGLLDVVGNFAPFLAGSNSGAHADLIYMLLLSRWPVQGFTKWREAQRTRLVTGLLGSDVHQDISIDPVCTGAYALPCQLAAAGSPDKTQALALLVAGGQITLTDGHRLDSYSRVLRWLENRVLATDTTMEGVKDALRAGRNYGLFSVFGGPDQFRFVGRTNAGLVEMGGDSAAPIELVARLPKRAVALAGVPFSATDGDKVEIRASLYRTTATETVLVKESTLLGDELTLTATEPGAYHIEIWIRPRHLVPSLGSVSELADSEYLWLITNPIRVR